MSVDDPGHARPEQDPQTLGPFLAGGAMLTVSSVLGLIMTAAQPGLSRRERLFAGAGCAALGAVGAGAWRSAPGFARFTRLRPQTAVLGLGAAATITTTLGGGHQSPGYFPAVVGAAVGGGYLSRGDSVRYGSVLGTLYIAGCLVTAKPWRGGTPDVWWNAGSAATFIAAASLGSRAGALSMTLRGFELARKRDQEIIQSAGLEHSSAHELTDRSLEVADAARAVEAAIAALTRRAQQSGSGGQDDLLARARQDAEGLHHLTLAPQLLGIAASNRLETLGDRVRDICAASGSDDVGIDVKLTEGVPAQIDARSATRLVQALKRALDNSRQHTTRRPLTVTVVVSATPDGDVALEVEDNGHGSAIPEEAWGEGLQSTRDQLAGIGGQLELHPAAEGVRLHVVVPVIEREPLAAKDSTILESFDQTMGQILADLRFATAWQAAMILCAGTPPSQRPRLARRLILILAAGEATARVAAGATPRWASPALPATAILAVAAFPGPGRPVTGGWSTILVVEHIARAGTSGYLAAGAVTAASMLAAGRATLTEPHVTLGDRMFPLFACIAGLLEHRQRTGLAAAEAELLALGDQLALIEQVALPLQLQHDVLKQLRRSPAWSTLVGLPEGQQLVDAEEALLKATSKLEPLLSVPGSPIDILVAQLRFRLAPSRIRLPNKDVLSELAERRRIAGQSLRAGRERLWLIRLGDEIAEAMIALVPPSPTGRWQLREVIIALELHGDDLKLTFRPIPVARRPGIPRVERLGRVAAALGGQIVEGYEDGVRSISVPAAIFTP